MGRPRAGPLVTSPCIAATSTSSITSSITTSTTSTSTSSSTSTSTSSSTSTPSSLQPDLHAPINSILKIKTLPGGSRADCHYIDGLVCR